MEEIVVFSLGALAGLGLCVALVSHWLKEGRK